MTTPPPSTLDAPAPGAVQPSSIKPVVWWVVGGVALLGAGALAASLARHPQVEAATPAVPFSSSKSQAAPARTTKAPDAKAVPAAAVCATCGTVESGTSEKQKGEGTGIGAVGGAVVGGVVGHQMGGGDGKKVMTVLGAVGGGFAGHEVEKHVRSTTVYHVKLRMDDGSTRSLTQSAAPAVGARFEVQGNQLKPLAQPAKG